MLVPQVLVSGGNLFFLFTQLETQINNNTQSHRLSTQDAHILMKIYCMNKSVLNDQITLQLFLL